MVHGMLELTFHTATEPLADANCLAAPAPALVAMTGNQVESVRHLRIMARTYVTLALPPANIPVTETLLNNNFRPSEC